MINGTSKAHAKLFEPLTIANGRIKLKHRVIYAPMTRLQGVPLREGLDDEEPTRAWYPDEVIVEYYSQRASDGGLLISEGIPPSQQVQSSVLVHLHFKILTPQQRAQGLEVPQDCTIQSRLRDGKRSQTLCMPKAGTFMPKYGTPDALLFLFSLACHQFPPPLIHGDRMITTQL